MLITYYLHDQKFIYILPEHDPRPWASICLLLLLSSSLTTTTTFLCLCCVRQPKQNSGLAVLPDECLELICKSCSKLRYPYCFRILRFGKNGTLVSLSATRKAKKGRKFFVVLLVYDQGYYSTINNSHIHRLSSSHISFQQASVHLWVPF